MECRSRGLVAATAIALVLGGVSRANAQSDVPLQTGETENSSSDDIIVTADRRPQRLGDVTSTINVATGEQIRDRGISEVRDLDALAPNLSVRSSFANASNPVITIRGVGISDFNDNNSSPAGVYVDDVYYVSPPMLAFGLYDLERVEVLKGPQGTLYGRNTTSGAVNFITRRPSFEYQATGRVAYESYDRVTAETGIGGPLLSTLAFRIAGMVDNGGNYVFNRFDNRRTGGRNLLAGRMQLLWEPTSNLKLLINVHAARDRSAIGQYQHVGLLDPVTFAPCASAQEGQVDSGCVDIFGYSDRDGDVQAGDYNKTGRFTYDSFGTSARIDYNIGAVTLTSITAYEGFSGGRPDESDASPNQLLETDYEDVNVKQLSQELRALGKIGRFDWIVGGYYGYDRIRASVLYDLLRDFRPITGFDPAQDVFAARNRYVQKTKVLAGFAHIRGELANRFELEAGLRYTNERRKFNTVSILAESASDLATIGLAPDGIFLDESRRISPARLSWMAGANYRSPGGTLVYGKISNGFRSGGFNGGIPLEAAQVVPFQPETLTAYELGIKGALFDRAVRFEVAGFLYDYKDLQVFTLDNTGGAPVQILTNAADSEIYGLDASVSVRLSEGLDLSAALGLLSARYQNANIGGRDLSGSRLTNAPTMSFTGSINYEQPIGSLLASFSTNAKYQSRELIDSIEFPVGPFVPISQRPYWVVDARIGLSTADERVGLSIFVKNVFDVRPLLSALPLADFGFSENSYGLQRRFGIAVDFEF